MNEQSLLAARELIAGFLASRRKALGISQQSLADATGLGIQTVKRMEDAKFWPGLKQFLIVCEALDLHFFAEEKDSGKPLSEAMRKRWQRPSESN